MKNIVEILKKYPKGTKLYSPLCGECELYSIYTDNTIVVKYINDNKLIRYFTFNEDGSYIQDCTNSDCLLFPSKENRDWSTFQRPFKDGDVITCTNSACSFVSIFKEMNTNVLFRRYVSLTLDDESQFWTKETFADFKNPRLATEEEKQKLFDAIKDNGYKWNTETKTLEKLIKPWTIQDAKDGDVICYDDGWTCIFKCIHGIWFSSYCFITDDGEFHTSYETHAVDSVINGNAHPATKEQCNRLFQKIKEAGYKWNAETKTLDKLIDPKFKVGDRVKHISAHTPGIVVKVGDKGYYIDYPKCNGVCYISFTLEKDYELLPPINLISLL